MIIFSDNNDLLLPEIYLSMIKNFFGKKLDKQKFF